MHANEYCPDQAARIVPELPFGNKVQILGVAKLSQYEYEITFTYNFLTVTVKPHMVGK